MSEDFLIGMLAISREIYIAITWQTRVTDE